MLGRPSSFCSSQFNAEYVGEPAGDLVLQSEQIASVTVEPLRHRSASRSRPNTPNDRQTGFPIGAHYLCVKGLEEQTRLLHILLVDFVVWVKVFIPR